MSISDDDLEQRLRRDLAELAAVPTNRARERRAVRRSRPAVTAAIALTVVLGLVSVAAVAITRREPSHAAPRHPSTTTVERTPTTPEPGLPSRTGAALAYDAARSEVVLFGGGHDGYPTLNDTWIWNGDGWGAAHPATVPPARQGAVMAYDPSTEQVVLFGGTQWPSKHSEGVALNDTWTWDGFNWTRRITRHPPPWSDGLAMAFDPRSRSILLLTLPSIHPNLDLSPTGIGVRGVTRFGTWQWNGTDWNELDTGIAPEFVTASIAVHGNARLTPLPDGAGLLFYSWAVYDGSCPPDFPPSHATCGGGPDPNGTRDSQTWTWDGTRWTQQHPTRAPVAVQLVATPGAGSAPTIFASDGATWRWTGSNWDQAPTRGAAPSNEGFAVYDEADADVVAYAAQPDNFISYDTWTWNGHWTKRSQAIAPAPTTLPPATALDRQHVHASLQLDAGSVQSGASIGATVTFVNNTGVALRVPGCFSFFQVVIGDVHGPFAAGWRTCLQYFTVPIGTSSQPAKLLARSQFGTSGTVPAYTPGRYYAYVVFDDLHPQVVAPAPVPVQVVGPAPTATTP
jgi:hypothetical protein